MKNRILTLVLIATLVILAFALFACNTSIACVDHEWVDQVVVDGYVQTQVCNKCGDTRRMCDPISHNFKEHRDNGDGTHTSICGSCDGVYENLPHSYKGVVTTPAGCETVGLTLYTCDCGATYTEVIPALGHAYTGAYTPNGEGQHTRVCANGCGIPEISDCSGGNSTCTVPGMCEYCGGEYIDATGHTVVVDPEIPATCTEDGLTEGKSCSVCHEIIVAQEVIPAGHTIVDDPEVPATCTVNGLTAGKHCSECGTIIVAQEVIIASHTIVVDPAIPATCTEDGITEGSHCSVCKEVIVAQEVVSAYGHVLSERKENIVPATCTTEGSYDNVTYCSICNDFIDSEHIIVPVKDHTPVVDNAVEATCTATGLTEGSHCSICETIIVEQVVVPATDHTAVIDEAVEPTCTDSGLTEGSHCSICETIIVEQVVVPAKDHTAVIDEAVEPTCTDPGLTEGSHCSACGEKLISQEVVPAIEHSFLEESDWLDSQNGINHYKYCANECGATLVRDHQYIVDELGNYVCADCGYSHKDEFSQPEEDSDHVHKYVSVVVAPTCTNRGSITYKCKGCDHSVTNFIEPLGHTEGESVVENLLNSTCYSNGSYDTVVYCTVCSAELNRETAEMEMLPHNIKYISNNTELDLVEHTGTHTKYCANEGCGYEDDECCTLTENTCEELPYCIYCGDVFDGVLGHEFFGEVLEVVDPTCKEDGYKLVQCMNAGCSATQKQYISGTKLPHTEEDIPGKDATCDEDGLTDGKYCSVCGTTIVEQEVIPAGHIWREWISADISHHVKVCERDHNHELYESHNFVTGEPVAPTCEEKGYTPHNCSICGESYRDSYVPALGHTVEIDEAVAPTCTEKGYTEGSHCSTCGEIFVKQEEIPVNGHSYVSVVTEPTCTEEGYTTYTCTVCGENYTDNILDATGHSYNSVVTEPTCTVDGYTTHTCSACGDSYTDNEVPALGHAYNSVWNDCCDGLHHKQVCANGCGIDIVRDHHYVVVGSNYECTDCGYVYGAEITEPSQGEEHTHEYINAVSKPDCENNGYIISKCRICDHTVVCLIDALGHTEVIDAAVEATCTEAGLTEGKHCSVCGEVLVAQEIVDALGHTGVVDKAVAPTCTATGLTEGKHCSVCNTVLVAQETVEALGHTEAVDKAVAPTCTATGLTEGKHCSVCNTVLVAQETISSTGHNYESAVTNPTCTEKGYTTYTCSNCEDSYISDYVDAFGHDFSDSDWLDSGDGANHYKLCANGCGEITLEAHDIQRYWRDEDTGLVYGAEACLICGYQGKELVLLTEGEYPVANEYELDIILNGYKKQSLSAVLENDITITEPIVLNQEASVVLHLDGHTISSSVVNENGTSIFEAGYGAGLILYLEGGNILVDVDGADDAYFFNSVDDYSDGLIIYGEEGSSSTISTTGSQLVNIESVCYVYIDAPDTQFIAGGENPETFVPGHMLPTVIYGGVFVNWDPTEYVSAKEGEHAHITVSTDAEGNTIYTVEGFATIGVDAVEPTCTENGLTAGTVCSECGEAVVPQEIIPANGHTEEIDVAVAPTCTATGLTEGKHCSVCKTVLVAQEIVDALGHTEVIDAAVEATCTATGLTEGKHCSVCNTVLVAQEIVDALGHTEVIDEAVAPTCTETGLAEGKHCSACGEELVEQEIIPANGHVTHDDNIFECDICKAAIGYDLADTEHYFNGQYPYSGDSDTLLDGDKILIGLTSKNDFYLDFASEENLGDTVSFNNASGLIDINKYVLTTERLGDNEYAFRTSFGKHLAMNDDGTLAYVDSIDNSSKWTLSSSAYGDDKYVPYVTFITNKATGKSIDLTEKTSEAQQTYVVRKYEGTKIVVFRNVNIGHDVTVNSNNDDTHTLVCSICGVISDSEACYGGKADCENKAICDCCGEEYGNALGHTEVTDAAVAPTCTETGLTEGKHCSVCGEVLVAQEVVPAFGHTEVIDEAVAPACTTTGLTEGKHCSVCGEVLVAQETVPALGHTEAIDSAVAPTCTETGLTEGKHCAVCGEELVAQELVSATGHAYVWVNNGDGTCSGTCQNDNSHVIAKEPHDIKADGCSKCGYCVLTYTLRTNDNGEQYYAISGRGANFSDMIDENGVVDLTKYVPETIGGISVTYLGDCGEPYVMHADGVERPTVYSPFYRSTDVVSVVIPDFITLINYGAFYDNDGIEYIEIPASVTEIGRQAFDNTDKLKQVTFAENSNLKTIELYAFWYSSGLENITIPASVTNVGLGAFSQCANLESVTFAEGSKLTIISQEMFSRSTKLESISIPEGVTYIDISAFRGCTGLTEIYLPSTLTMIRQNAFADCTALADVYYSSCAENWAKVTVEMPGEKTGNSNLLNATMRYAGEYILTTVDATCTTEGSITSVCSICGYTAVETISVISHNYNSVVTDPTCTEQGYTTHTCSACGDSYRDSEVEATGHKITSASDNGDGTCTGTCTICGEEATGQHSYGNWNSSLQKQVHYRKCSACGARDEEACDGEIEIIPATCVTGTTTIYHECSVCKGSKTKTESDALGHSYSYEYNGDGTHTATCTREGCNESTEGHTIAGTCSGGVATCETAGVCELCGGEYIPALGHDEISHEGQEATCTEIGWNEYVTCSRCDYTTYLEIAPGHVYGVATYYLVNETENLVAYGQECTRCGEWKLLNYATYNQLNNVYNEDEMRLLLEHGYGARAQADIVITSPIVIDFANINSNTLDEENNIWNSTVSQDGTVTKGTKLVYLNVNANNHIISSVDGVEAMFITNTRLNLTNGSNGTTAGKFIASEYIVINRGTNYSNATQFTTAEFISNGDAIIKMEGNAADKSGSFAIFVSGNFVVNGSNPTMINIDEYSNAYEVHAAHILAGTYYNWNPNTAPVLIYVAHTATPLEDVTNAWILEHTYEVVEYIPGYEPTCTEGGKAYHRCGCAENVYEADANGSTKVYDVAPLGHTEVIDEAVAPTCTATGLTEGKHCSVCNTVLVEQQIVAANGHSNSALGDWVKNGDNTCSDVCTVCGVVLERSAHNLVDIASNGELYYGCERCDYIVYHFTLNADGNSYTLSAFGADFRNYAMKNDGNIVLPSTVNGLSVTAVGASDATAALTTTSQIKTLTIPASVKSIGNNAFAGCSGLTNIYFEENSQLETIGERAFANCIALTSVEIPKSVITLGKQAFSMPSEGNASLAEVTFEEGSQLKTIGDYAFSSCKQLTTIEIPENVTKITYGAFKNCTSLETVTFAGNKVTYFGSAIFYGCTSLKNIDIPSTLTTLGKQAFRECTSLESVVIPAGIVSPVQGIDDATFVGCTSLKQVVILCELQTIKICLENGEVLDAFDGCTSLTDVFYAYSKEQMSTVANIGNIKAFENVTFHYNTTSAHEYTIVTDEAVAPTCTETGLTEGSHCSVCGAVIVAQETIAIDPTAHNWGDEWVDSGDGVNCIRYCLNGCTDAETIEHDIQRYWKDSETGITYHAEYCLRCDTVLMQGEDISDDYELIVGTDYEMMAIFDTNSRISERIVTFDGDVAISKPIFVDDVLELHLNGHTLTGSGKNDNGDVVLFIADGAADLIFWLNGGSVVAEGAVGENAYICEIYDGLVTVVEGDEQGLGGVVSTTGDVMFKLDGPSCFVSRGSVRFESAAKVANEVISTSDNYSGQIHIYSGIFEGWDPSQYVRSWHGNHAHLTKATDEHGVEIYTVEESKVVGGVCEGCGQTI